MSLFPLPPSKKRLLIFVAVAVFVVVACASLAESGMAQVQSPTPAPSASVPASPSPTPSGASDWNKNIDSTQKAITALAVIIGGIWAWLKFFRGRTFRSRIELALSAKIIMSGNSKFLKATMEMKNVGLSQVILKTDAVYLDVFLIDVATVRSADRLFRARWGEPATFEVFQDHAWVEPSEEISDELLLQLPDNEQLACKLKLTVNSRGSFIRKQGTRWSATAIIDSRPAPPADEPTTEAKGKKS